MPKVVPRDALGYAGHLKIASKVLVLKGLNRKIKALCGASLWLHYSQSSVVYVAETPD